VIRPSSALILLFAALLGCLVSTGSAANKPEKIVVARLDAQELAELREVAPRANIVPVADARAALAEIHDADALIGVLDEQLVRQGKNLRWIQVFSAGVDRYRYPELIESEIVLTNAKVIQGPNVADQAMALLLALTRRVVFATELARKDGWREARSELRDGTPPIIELEGKTGLVVGYGGIGSAIAERAHGFGMRILAVDPKPGKPHPEWVEHVYTPDELLRALPEADVVFLAVPLTDETQGMMGRDAFASMKDGAYLVNIARGKVVDTEALVSVLESGKLAGAGLDVTDPEPLPPEHRLWSFDNVVVTPHMGGTSDQVWARRVALAKDNLARFVEGRELVNIVDKKRGY
jgi:phosphoglycerate dehydrogenase-like enzyme